MKKIALSGKRGVGKFALVDDEDFEWLNQWKWHYQPSEENGYATRLDMKTHKTILMHRLILNCPRGKETDHRDTVGLNNQRYNLRACSRSQNEWNKNRQSNNTSGFKGVSFYDNRYNARIQKNKSPIYLGRFVDPESAAKAYDAKAKELFGDFARLNFPR
jgi:hypothetical protein